jgi:hypothetical protein
MGPKKINFSIMMILSFLYIYYKGKMAFNK